MGYSSISDAESGRDTITLMQAFHPAFAATIKIARAPLSDDPDTAVAQTIRKMAGYVRADRGSRLFQQLASQLRGSTARETKRNVFRWIKARVRFVNDSEIAALLHVPEWRLDRSSIAEVLIRPLDIVRMVDAMGDCDDFSMLGACLLTAAGVHCVFVTLAADPREPTQYSHVYIEAGHEAFDSSHGPYVGWEARNRFGKRQLWSVETGMPITNAPGFGLGRLGDDGLDSSMFDVGNAAGTFESPTGGTLQTISYSLPTISEPAVPGAVQTDLTALENLFSSPSMSLNLPVPTSLNSGGGGALPTDTSSSGAPWWSSLVTGALGTASSILKMQYLPSNAIIQSKPGSFIATGTAASSGIVSTGAGLFSGSFIWIVIAVLVLFLLMKKK
jgi:hypothetical protein